MNRTIKFSNIYRKLHGIDLSKGATLIRMEEVQDIRHLPENFIAYDSVYSDKQGNKKYYPLKKEQKYLVLYFMDAKGTLFTTIRRWTKEKWSYYFESQGNSFDIKIL